MNIHFIYVSQSDEYEEKLRDDWPYVPQMAKFYRWWLRETFSLHCTINVDVLVIEKTWLMRLRFGMNDLIKHHKEKGELDYHFYLSYFKPVWSDCSSGFFTDNMGLIKWKEFRRDAEKHTFFALENCSRVSHILLHEVGRQKHYDNKIFGEKIHEQWDKHLYGVEEFEFYDKKFQHITDSNDIMFATMKVPLYKH